ncbi:apolipoprotein N-acyltransferase [Candidatus Bipolaricaulota bacterium]|nr:apolipoprotein N-acyltransferase [Candidatus Bipolaricaulota bacterium]
MAKLRIQKIYPWLAGAVLALSMPSGHLPLGVMVFAALVPALLLHGRRSGFLTGWALGVAFFAVDLRWLLTLWRFTPMVLAGYIALIGFYGLSVAIWKAAVTLAERRWGTATAFMLVSPFLWTLMEWLRAQGSMGFGFSTLYSALYRTPELIQAASVFGPWFMSTLILLANGGLALAARRRSPFPVLLSCVVIAIAAVFAVFPISSTDSPPEPMSVAVIGSDVTQDVKLDGIHLLDLRDRYLQLGATAAEAQPDLIVFPESILPGYILVDSRLLPRFEELARSSGISLLFGTGDLRDGKVYNAAVLIGEDGQVKDRYDMIRLVPFGEWIPARGLLDRLGLGVLVRSFLPLDVSRGADVSPVDVYGTPICFESSFPAITRGFAANGAELLVVITNDAWFAYSSELEAHFACAVFRAVETRRYLAQAANGGISGVIDPRGSILAESGSQGILSAEVELRRDRSLYVAWGEIPLLLGWIAAWIAWGVWIRVRTRLGAKRSAANLSGTASRR